MRKVRPTKKRMYVSNTRKLAKILECFSQSKLGEHLTGATLAGLSHSSCFGDLVWVCIANKVQKGDEAWTKLAVEILEVLDPNLAKYRETVEPRVRVTFGELQDMRLVKWSLAEDLLDAGVHLSYELQNMLFTELSDFAYRVAGILYEDLTTGEARYFFGIVKELPWLKPLETMLPKELLLAPRGGNGELQPHGKTNVSTKTESLFEIDKIWEQFHETRDDYYRNLLMERYRDFVRYCAERLHGKLRDKVELDDLVSAGIFGLMDAIDTFDPTRSVKFETYCSPRIRGSILDELQSMDCVS